MKGQGFVIVATGALLTTLAAAGPATAARTFNGSTPLAFCSALVNFDAQWPQIDLQFPDQPFFNDGNNDGIADMLQVGRAKLPSLGSGLEGLARQAPPALQSGLRTLGADVQALARERAPSTAAQSSREVLPVEQVASGVQHDLKATGCLAKVQAANTAADHAGESPAGSSGQDAALAVLLVFAVVNLPLIGRVWRHARRPATTRDGSRFKGNLRRWKIETLTGEVLHVDRTSEIHASYGAAAGPGGYIPIGSTIQRVTEVLRLDVVGGPPRDAHLVNFTAHPTPGDLVTVCYGRKRSKRVPFAVLNHTTKRQDLQLQNLFSLREGGTGRQVLMVWGIIFGALVNVFIAVFIGAWWVLGVWVALLVAFAVLSRREAAMDTRPLWRRADAEREMRLV